MFDDSPINIIVLYHDCPYLIEELVNILQTVNTDGRPPLGLTTHIHGWREHSHQHLLTNINTKITSNLIFVWND